MAWETYILRRPKGTGKPARAHWLMHFGNRTFSVGPIDLKMWGKKVGKKAEPQIVARTETWRIWNSPLLAHLQNKLEDEGYTLEQSCSIDRPPPPRAVGLPDRVPIRFAQMAYSAVTDGDFGALRSAIAVGIDCNLRVNGLTALIDVAVQESQPMMVEYLLSVGASAKVVILRRTDKRLGEVLIESLLQRGALPDRYVEWLEGKGPISSAAFQRCARYVKLPEQAKDQAEVLRTALRLGDSVFVRTLMEQGRALVDADPSGDSMLHVLAMKRSSLSALESCLRLLNPELLTWHDPAFTPLHAAANMGNIGAMELLLRHGVDPEVRDRRGRTALDLLREYLAINPAVAEDLAYQAMVEALTPRS